MIYWTTIFILFQTLLFADPRQLSLYTTKYVEELEDLKTLGRDDVEIHLTNPNNLFSMPIKEVLREEKAIRELSRKAVVHIYCSDTRFPDLEPFVQADRLGLIVHLGPPDRFELARIEEIKSVVPLHVHLSVGNYSSTDLQRLAAKGIEIHAMDTDLAGLFNLKDIAKAGRLHIYENQTIAVSAAYMSLRQARVPIHILDPSYKMEVYTDLAKQARLNLHVDALRFSASELRDALEAGIEVYIKNWKDLGLKGFQKIYNEDEEEDSVRSEFDRLYR